MPPTPRPKPPTFPSTKSTVCESRPSSATVRSLVSCHQTSSCARKCKVNFCVQLSVARRVPPPRYAWADPAYDVVHASIVSCHADLLAALQGVKSAETTAEDNLKTLDLVFAAYESARTRQAVELTR